jgi:hypothetical protein
MVAPDEEEAARVAMREAMEAWRRRVQREIQEIINYQTIVAYLNSQEYEQAREKRARMDLGDA